MTDGASGSSIDEPRQSNFDPGPAIALGILILIFMVMSGFLGYSIKSTEMKQAIAEIEKAKCPEWARAKEVPLHKHGVRK